MGDKNITLQDQRTKQPKLRGAVVLAIIFSAVYAVALLACFLVDFFTSKQIDWFYIVLTSVLTLFSVTVVPLICTSKRLMNTLGCFIISLTFLFFAISRVTKADWFSLVTPIVISGILIISGPLLVRYIPLKKSLSNKKALLVMIADTVLVTNILIVIGVHVGSLEYLRITGLIAPVSMLLFWYLFYIIRYLKGVACQKVGLCFIGLGGYEIFLPFYINTIVLSESNDRNLWNIILGCVFILVGILLTFIARRMERK